MRASIGMRLNRDERGVYAILFAIIIVVLFTMVAIAVDLSNARAEVRANQSRTDLAALAAAAHLPGDPVAACNEAWNYILLNVPGIPSTATFPCSSFSGGCTAATPANEVEVVVGSYRVTFTYPVPDDHEYMTADGQTIGVADGANPCERWGVRIITEQDVLFGGIVGSDGLNTPATAVSKSTQDTGRGSAVALLLLDPTGCNALVASGQASVMIFAHDGANPGRITLDSDGRKPANPNVCGNNSYTVDANDNQPSSVIKACGNSFIPAEESRCDAGGIIQLFGMRTGQTTCLPSNQSNACDPVDTTNIKLFPIPMKAEQRSTRQTVDWEYNCKSGYPNYAPYGTPSIRIQDCLTGMPPYQDQLIAGVGATGASSPGLLWTPIVTCSPPDGTVFPPGNYWVNCNDFRVGSGNTVTFEGGNIVFRRDVTIQGTLRVNTANPVANLVDTCRRPNALTGNCLLQSSARHAYMVLRNGGVLTKGAQGSMNLNRTMVRLTSGGRINVGAGAPAVRWTAPFQKGFPTADDPSTPDVNEESPPGPFDKLALWSESTADHDLGGQSPLLIEGIYFIPNALFNFDGQATQFLDKAQFLTFRMNVSGQGQLRMQPNPQFVLQFPLFNVRLIR